MPSQYATEVVEKKKPLSMDEMRFCESEVVAITAPCYWVSPFGSVVLGGIAGTAKDERGPYAWVNCSAEAKLIYRETTAPLPDYDQHHIQISRQRFGDNTTNR